MIRYAYLGRETVSCAEDVYDVLAEAFNFPEYFGRNLDALYDCLTDGPSDRLILIADAEVLAETLGEFYPRLLQVLSDSESAVTVRLF